MFWVSEWKVLTEAHQPVQCPTKWLQRHSPGYSRSLPESLFFKTDHLSPRKWYCCCQDICSKPSVHDSSLQKWATNYLECPLTSCLFIFPEISPPSHGDLKVNSLPDLSMLWLHIPMRPFLQNSLLLWYVLVAVRHMKCLSLILWIKQTIEQRG